MVKKTCLNCSNFQSCQVGDDPRGYCSTNPDVLGYCSLWDWALFKTDPCEGWEALTGREYMGTDFNSVSAGYFRTLRIPLLEGRVFSEQDRAGAEPVAVVSQAFADRAWPGESALGRRIHWGGGEDSWLTVVGVVGDTQNQFLTDVPGPFLYRPLAQDYSSEGYLVVRSSADQASVGRAMQEGLRTLDPRISLSPVISLGRYTETSILPQRIAGLLSSVLGLLALLLSGMGVYGVMAFMVALRRREIGIRSALGAEPRTVLASVLSGAFRMALPGLLVGGGLAVAVGFLLQSLLLGVGPLDFVALVGMTGLVLAMVLAGTLVPARRAARVDPAEALRYD